MSFMEEIYYRSIEIARDTKLLILILNILIQCQWLIFLLLLAVVVVVLVHKIVG